MYIMDIVDNVPCFPVAFNALSTVHVLYTLLSSMLMLFRGLTIDSRLNLLSMVSRSYLSRLV